MEHMLRGFEQINLVSVIIHLFSVIIHHFGVDEVLFLGARNVSLQKNLMLSCSFTQTQPKTIIVKTIISSCLLFSVVFMKTCCSAILSRFQSSDIISCGNILIG